MFTLQLCHESLIKWNFPDASFIKRDIQDGSFKATTASEGYGGIFGDDQGKCNSVRAGSSTGAEL